MNSDNTHLRAALRLHLAEGVGAITYGKLVAAFGSAEAVTQAAPELWQRVEGIGPKTARVMAAVTDQDVDEELAAAEQMGATIIALGDDCYPRSLANIHDPPAVLYVRGQLRDSDAVAMGMVGSRHCTHYGLEQAGRFAELLGRAGFTVISGGARGIDTAAHRGAMNVGGRTIAVMGCGLGTHFPPENAELFESIVADGRGALVSELPMRTAVLAGNFPTRNRIISGMSLGVLVVEAARRSGSLITARQAAEQGKTVFAVPGRVDSAMSQGTNDLIRNGSILTQGLEDILEHLGEVGQSMQDSLAGSSPGRSASASGAGPLFEIKMDDTEKKLYDALAQGPRSLDELVRLCRLDTGRAAAAMTMLAIKGAISQQPGNVFARKR